MDVTDTHRKIPSTPQMSQVRRPFLGLVTVTILCWQWGHVIRPGVSVRCGTMATTTGMEKHPVTSTDNNNNAASGRGWARRSYDSGERLTRLNNLGLLWGCCGVHVNSLSCWMWGGDVRHCSKDWLHTTSDSLIPQNLNQRLHQPAKNVSNHPKTQIQAGICCSFILNGAILGLMIISLIICLCCIIRSFFSPCSVFVSCCTLLSILKHPVAEMCLTNTKMSRLLRFLCNMQSNFKKRTKTEVLITYQVELDRLPRGGQDKVVLALVLACSFPYSPQSQEKRPVWQEKKNTP